MVATFGWTGVVLVFVLGSHFVLRKLNSYSANSVPIFVYLSKISKKIHPLTGFMLLIIGLVHGNMALGRVTLHTGTLLWVAILVMLMTIMGFKHLKWAVLFKAHKYFDVVVLIFLGLHLFARNLI